VRCGRPAGCGHDTDCPDPVVTNAHPAAGQGVQQEAPDKFLRDNVMTFTLLPWRESRPAKRHLALVHRHQAIGC